MDWLFDLPRHEWFNSRTASGRYGLVMTDLTRPDDSPKFPVTKALSSKRLAVGPDRTTSSSFSGLHAMAYAATFPEDNFRHTLTVSGHTVSIPDRSNVSSKSVS
jgi:hypothetical protein